MKNLFFLVLLAVSLNGFAEYLSVLNHLGGKGFIEEFMVPEPTKVKKIRYENLDSDTEFRASSQLCGNLLTPIHETQRDKEYHLEVTATYYHHGNNRISGLSELCAVPQRSTTKCRGLEGNDELNCLEKHLRCLKPKVFKITVISDTYSDSCGNRYRGFGVKTYTIPGEKIDTLVSRGHSILVDKIFSRGIRSYRAGKVKSVDYSAFLFLSAL